MGQYAAAMQERKRGMGTEIENVLPAQIEKRSFEIITQELKEQGIILPEEQEAVIKRCIHTSEIGRAHV